MNFPFIEFPWIGNGTIIALIATIHVLFSHGVAVGAIALMVSLEYRAHKTNNLSLENFTRTLSKWILIITTTAGAMTGVGIWFSTTVIEPASIGSLLRIFFWAWFAEWIVFVTEVILLITYFYTWDKWKGIKKKLHLRTGVVLAIASWLTMAIITGVLAAKLTPGKWTETLSFWNAFFNPTYLPSLFFRTFVAIILAAAFITFVVKIFVKDKVLQGDIFSVFSKWMMVSLPALLLFGSWYLSRIPDAAYQQVIWSTGMNKDMFTIINLAGLIVFILFALWMWLKPKNMPLVLALVVFVASIGFIAEFEMVRESIRKPYIIYDYMYANGVLAKEAPLYNEEGFLPHMSFLGVEKVTAENHYEAGQALYRGQCLACHTIDGWREKRAFANRLDGWSEDTIAEYVRGMHEFRQFMPPFVGTEEELQALAHYLATEVASANQVQLSQGGNE